MFDDRAWEAPAGLQDYQPLGDERGRVHGHLADHGPLPVVDLQGDLYPHDAGRFRQVLAALGRAGILEVTAGTVDASIDPAVLGDAETATLQGATLTLRPARGRDFRRLLDLTRSVATGSRQSQPPSVARELVADSRIHRWNNGTGRVVYVATVDGRVCGWAHVTTVPETGGRLAELSGGVAGRFRGEGIGSRLLQYVLDRSLTREHGRVYQHIPAGDDDAFQFLRMHGWHVEACGTDSDELRVVQDV